MRRSFLLHAALAVTTPFILAAPGLGQVGGDARDPDRGGFASDDPDGDAMETIRAETITDEHVRKAIDAMVEGLYAAKDGRRDWNPASWDENRHGSVFQNGGYTALAVLSLLYAGESYQDPRLRTAVDRLARARLRGTYAIAIRTSVWAKLPPKFGPQLDADTQWLLEGFSDGVGSWAYDQRPNTTRRDNSIRQYGALALWEAAKRGHAVDRRYWQRLEEAFIDNQHPSGGWSYRGNDAPPTGSMTAAGLATLFITQDLLHAEAAVTLRTPTSSRNLNEHRQAVERGLAWMNEHFSPLDNPGSFRDFYYYMYGVERVGLASGLKHFGEHDWYREGAAEMIRRLCTWDERTATMTLNERVGGKGNGAVVQVRHLAFGLMFLSRGRVPVAVNKLRVPELAWNNRPRDVANLTRWIAETSETDLNWQIVGLDAEPDAWLDAPMLYLASNRPVPWVAGLGTNSDRLQSDVREHRRARAAGEISVDTPLPASATSAELRKLKRYLDLGGMLFAVNEGSSPKFASSIERLGTLLYPEHEWRTLPDTHWAYTIHAQVPSGKPVLKGLSNGVRELIVLCPSGDVAAVYQRGHDTHDTEADDAPEFLVAANLFLYASELNRARPRLARHVSTPDAFIRARRTVTVVRAEHTGNCRPEPLALETFRTHFASSNGIEIRILDRPLYTIGELQPRPILVFVSGIDAQEFSRAERDAIQKFVTTGGTILFETPGGHGEFTVSAEQMASEVFGLPVHSMRRASVITGAGLEGGSSLGRVEYRPYSFEVFGARETTPRLRGVMIDGEPRLLFSREDLSHALLDQPRWGVSGYAPDAARRLLANVVLHSINE